MSDFFGVRTSWRYFSVVCVVFITLWLFCSKSQIALRWATSAGNTALVSFLLDIGGNVHAAGDQPLMFAAMNGDNNMVKILLLHGADVNAANGGAMFAAVSEGKMSTVEFLVEHGADITGCRGHILAKVAEDYRHLDIEDYLINRLKQLPPDQFLCIYQRKHTGFLPNAPER
jgi:ankyrin repeat protein